MLPERQVRHMVLSRRCSLLSNSRWALEAGYRHIDTAEVCEMASLAYGC